MFEPEYSEEELPRDEDKKAVSTTEPAVAESRKIFINIYPQAWINILRVSKWALHAKLVTSCSGRIGKKINK